MSDTTKSENNIYRFKVAHLMGIGGEHKGRLAPLSDFEGVTIGKALNSHIVLQSKAAANSHCRIFLWQNQWHISNDVSGWPVAVNNNAAETAELFHGDVISIENDTFLFIEQELDFPKEHQLSMRYIEETFAPILKPSEVTSEKQIFLEEQTTTIGSENFNDIVLIDSSVSSNHGKIKSEEGLHTYLDLKSTNGSQINETVVNKETIITAGDELRVGKILFTFDFKRKDKTLDKSSRLKLTPLNLILFLIAGTAITIGLTLLIIIGLTVFSDIPPFGPTEHIVLKKLWISQEKSIIPFAKGHFSTSDYSSIAIAPSQKRIVCLDGKTGFAKWSHSTLSKVQTIDNHLSKSDENQLLVTTRERIFTTDNDGHRLWETPFGEFYTPILHCCKKSSLLKSQNLINNSSVSPVFLNNAINSLVLESGRMILFNDNTGEIHSLVDAVSTQARPLWAWLSSESKSVIFYITQAGNLVCAELETNDTQKQSKTIVLWETMNSNFALNQNIIITDIERDGTKEVLVLSQNRKTLSVIEVNKGRTITRLETKVAVTASPAIVSTGLKSNRKIALCLANETLSIFDMTTGNETSTATLAGSIILPDIVPVVFDINRDGWSDIITTSKNGVLSIKSLENSAIIGSIKLSSPSSGRVDLADINGDKRIDIIVELVGGQIETLTVNCPCESGELVR